MGTVDSRDDLVKTLPRSERGRGRRDVLPAMRGDAMTLFRRGKGYKIDLDHVTRVAYYLRDTCGFDELRIEATLSHFDGF